MKTELLSRSLSVHLQLTEFNLQPIGDAILRHLSLLERLLKP